MRKLPPAFGRAVLRHHMVPGCAPAVAVVEEMVYGFSDRFRPVLVYIGYTFDHLPACVRIPLPRMEDAIFASFAARMAFSSLLIRSGTR